MYCECPIDNSDKEKLSLADVAKAVRRRVIEMLYRSQSGHPGGSLSAVDILTVLYSSKMRIDPNNPSWKDRDRFIASKGHCAPALYAILAEKGFFEIGQLYTLRQVGSILQGHPDMKRTPGVDLSTGSLGMGLSAGLGLALSARLNCQDYYTYVLLGDGELQEGQVWEAAMSAAKFKIDNCIAIVDYNGVQLDGTLDEIMPSVEPISEKWKSFGWNVINIDGHNFQQISEAIELAKLVKNIPTVVIARTIKGKGVSFMEGRYEWHGRQLSKHDYDRAMMELGGL